MEESMIFALAGNQNCGKTTLFNQLTGANQHVGNFPGVTVDSKIGVIRGTSHQVVDLPGIYSLSPYTQEEIVTRDFLTEQNPDGIINIIDATNVERNFYLTLQLLELQIPVVIALNMMDEVRANGGTIKIDILKEELGVPVVPISASKNEGVSELIERAVQVAERKRLPKRNDFCSGPVHRTLHAVVWRKHIKKGIHDIIWCRLIAVKMIVVFPVFLNFFCSDSKKRILFRCIHCIPPCQIKNVITKKIKAKMPMSAITGRTVRAVPRWTLFCLIKA